MNRQSLEPKPKAAAFQSNQDVASGVSGYLVYKNVSGVWDKGGYMYIWVGGLCGIIKSVYHMNLKQITLKQAERWL